MRRCFSVLVSAVMIGLLVPALATAQPQKKRPSRSGQLNSNFAKGPNVGARLPDISAFDADGKPLKLSSLKGSHSVIVFGCLT